MYNSERVRAPKRCPYEGHLKTTIRTFESSDYGNSVFIERPLKFVQRAYTDVQTTMRAVLRAGPISVNGDQSILHRDRVVQNRPHIYDVDDKILFPITHSTSACVYKPDNAKMHEYYTSNPLTLKTLVGYLAGEHEWVRTTKMEILDYVVEGRATDSNQGARSLLSEAPTDYNWMLYDTPAQNYIIESRSGRFYIPTDAILGGGAAYRSIPVVRTGNIFRSEEDLILVPATFLSSLKNERVYRHTYEDADWKVVYFEYRLSTYSAEINESGFAVFEQKAEYGAPFRIRLELTRVWLENKAEANVTQRNVDSTSYNEFLTSLGTRQGAAKVAALEELRTVELLAPQVRFSLLRENSLHFSGKRHGPYANSTLDDDSFRNMRTQIEEACAPLERRINVGRAEFAKPTPREQRNFETHRFDCNAAWIARDIQNKLNTRLVAPSLMNWDLLTTPTAKNINSAFDTFVRRNFSETTPTIAIDDPPSSFFGFTEDAQLQNTAYLEGLIMLYATDGSRYIAPIRNIRAELDTQIWFDIGTELAAPQDADFGKTWGEWSEYSLGMYTEHVATNDTRFFVPDYKINDDGENKNTGKSAREYFITHDGGLLCPQGIVLSPTLASADSDTLLAAYEAESYLHGSGNASSRIFRIAVSTVVLNGENMQKLTLFQGETQIDPEDFFQYGTTFQFVRPPPPILRGLNILDAAEATWPQNTARTEHLLYDSLGDRVVGFDFRAADAILCGPISPCPQLEIKRPVNNGAITLPPRIGNYELEFSLDSNRNHLSTKNNVYNLTRTGPLKVQCEYLEQTGDQPEHITLNIPKFERWDVILTETAEVYEHTFRHGRPEFIYISHAGELTQFTFNYRGKACPALQNADSFAFFKMFDRCVHPASSKTYAEWQADDKPYLLRWEELGLWGQVKEEQERFIIEFEPLEYGNEQEIEIYFVYENFFLESNHAGSKFTFVK